MIRCFVILLAGGFEMNGDSLCIRKKKGSMNLKRKPTRGKAGESSGELTSTDESDVKHGNDRSELG